eukprot:gene7902-5679_t
MPKLEALAGLNGHHQCDCIPVTRLPLSMGWEFALPAHVGADLATAVQHISSEAPFQPPGVVISVMQPVPLETLAFFASWDCLARPIHERESFGATKCCGCWTRICTSAVKAAMVDVLAFFNSHVPTWNQSARGDNFHSGLPGFASGSGSGASQYWCSKLINETEQQRGFPYDYVGVGRLDLFWPQPHPTLQRLADPKSTMPECCSITH